MDILHLVRSDPEYREANGSPTGEGLDAIPGIKQYRDTSEVPGEISPGELSGSPRDWEVRVTAIFVIGESTRIPRIAQLHSNLVDEVLVCQLCAVRP